MVDGSAAEVVEGDPHAHGTSPRYVHDVLPDYRLDWLAILFNNLHRPNVQVHGVVESAGISEGPLFEASEFHRRVDAGGIKCAVVDGG